MSETKTSNGASVSPPFPPTAASRAAEAASSNLLPRASQYYLRGTLPNTPLAVSVISAALGGLAIGSLVAGAQPYLRLLGSEGWQWARPQLGLYGFAMGAFHLWEFWTTAGWNPQKLTVEAFLLNNTNQYHYAHAFGLAEYIVSIYFFPKKFDSWFCSLPLQTLVIAVLVTAQCVRSLAMIHANTSFSHIVKTIRHDDHTLITHGVYGYSRHPSYVGFFYWAVATQLLLGNIVSTIAFTVVLSRFFSARIIDEEKHLVRFFGHDYVQYRKQVGTGLPFMVFAGSS